MSVWKWSHRVAVKYMSTVLFSLLSNVLKIKIYLYYSFVSLSKAGPDQSGSIRGRQVWKKRLPASEESWEGSLPTQPEEARSAPSRPLTEFYNNPNREVNLLNVSYLHLLQLWS